MMNCSPLILDVCNALMSNISGVKVMPEFPDEMQDLPLREPMISVGVNAIKVESGIEDVNNVSNNNSPVILTMRMSICVPKTMTGMRCNQLVDATITAMSDILPKYTIIGIKAGSISYSATLSALNVNVDVIFKLGNAF